MKYSDKVILIGAVFALSFLSINAQGAGGIRVLPESAIPYTGFLSKASFDQRFPGVMKASAAELDTGWYVIYEHETLNYYFGPILLESTGEDYLAQLTTTVEAAVQQRPTIINYRLELSYEPSASSEGEASDSAEGEASDSAENAYGSPPPPPPSNNIWTLIRGIFGV